MREKGAEAETSAPFRSSSIWPKSATRLRRGRLKRSQNGWRLRFRKRGRLDHHEAANEISQTRPYDKVLWKLILEAQERNDRDG